MAKIIIVLSQEFDLHELEKGVDYWVIASVMPTEIAERARLSGFSITTFFEYPENEDKLFQLISMAMLHNLEWTSLNIIR